MKNYILLFLIFAMSFLCLAIGDISDDTEADPEPPIEVVRVERVEQKKPAPKAAEKPEQSEQIMTADVNAINAGYEQMNKAAYPLTDTEREAIEAIVASEGGYCGYEFQAMVAECILNGCIAEEMRPLEIFERGDFWLTHDVAPAETTKRAVSDVFDKGVLPCAEKIRYYYNPEFCTSAAHESFKYITTCCGCRFFADWE